MAATHNNHSTKSILLSESTDRSDLKIVSFNIHGFNQGQVAITEMIDSLSPDVFLIQEQ